MIRRFFRTMFQRWHLSLFEKVIIVNSLLLLGGALAGLWVTSHNLESHHYLIDTAFIVGATLLGLLANFLLLCASFRPLFTLLATIRAVSGGKTGQRARITPSDQEISELAQAFNTMMDRLEATRREQTMLIIQAQEEERRRIALELHDETGQNMTALLVHTELLNQTLQLLPESLIQAQTRAQLAGGLRQLTKLTQDTLENVRVLAQQLRPSVLDDLGMPAAFRWLAEDGRQRLRLEVKLQMDGLANAHFPPAYETALFRIAQESLTNAARHGQAHQVTITLAREMQQIRLTIHDDGCGFDAAKQPPGLGIFGMNERASLLGGTLAIASRPGQGTTVRADLPLPVLLSENEKQEKE